MRFSCVMFVSYITERMSEHAVEHFLFIRQHNMQIRDPATACIGRRALIGLATEP